MSYFLSQLLHFIFPTPVFAFISMLFCVPFSIVVLQYPSRSCCSNWRIHLFFISKSSSKSVTLSRAAWRTRFVNTFASFSDVDVLVLSGCCVFDMCCAHIVVDTHIFAFFSCIVRFVRLLNESSPLCLRRLASLLSLRMWHRTSCRSKTAQSG